MFTMRTDYQRSEENFPTIHFQSGECKAETMKPKIFDNMNGPNGDGLMVDYKALGEVYVPPRVIAFAVTTESASGCAWDLYDLGASHHMSPCRKDFINFEQIPDKPLTAPNRERFMAQGIGEMMIKLPNGDEEVKM